MTAASAVPAAGGTSTTCRWWRHPYLAVMGSIPVRNLLKVAAPTYLYSGPSPTASLAPVAGLEVNAIRGNVVRASLHRKTAMVLATVHALGLSTPDTSGLPIIELPSPIPTASGGWGSFCFPRHLRHARRLPARTA